MSTPALDEIIKTVSEATLWDNLKRRANKTLRKIENIENTQKRYEVFTKPRYQLIQNLLEDIGKEFYRIFLYKAIQNGKQDDVSIEQTIKEFQFFFWPGYTTLNGNRVFIEGASKLDKDYPQHKYFAGIGNSKINSVRGETIEHYFNKTKNHLQWLSNESVFWVKNIPSTLAFDRVMNQFYLDIDANEKGEIEHFTSGSTHHWKSSQKELQKNGKSRFIPMPLKSDASELRILEVSIKTRGTRPLIDLKEKNKISILIPHHELPNAGDIIALFLSPDLIPVKIMPEDIKYYVPWPVVYPDKDSERSRVIDERLEDLQKKAYSFWISETLKITGKGSHSYSHIRMAFKQNKFPNLSKRFQPFQTQINTVGHGEYFVELYYSNWYTLFLESYGESVDLGTAMFLTNSSFDSDFLMKCSHWIRWIFNELRLLEAKTLVAKSTTVDDLTRLSHDLSSSIKTLHYWLNSNIKLESEKKEIDLTDFIIHNIMSYLSVGTTRYERYDPSKRTIDLSAEINMCISIYKITTLDIELFNKVFKKAIGSTEKDVFTKYRELVFLKCDLPSINIKSDLDLVRLLLKDLVENLIKHSDYNTPDCSIQLTKVNKEVHLLFLNSNWPSHTDLQLMRLNEMEPQRIGWRSINEIVSILNWKIELPDTHKKNSTDYFWIKVLIPDSHG